MNKEAFIFPGQGTQAKGMADYLFKSNPDVGKIANETFDQANDILHFDLKDLCLFGQTEDLSKPAITEPAILATSISAFNALKFYGFLPDVVAGHSLGEYSALVAAGSLAYEAALMLVKERGLAFEIAGNLNPGRMVAILKLPISDVELICKESGAEIANINSDQQIVIAGTIDSVEKASEIAREHKGLPIELNVNIASHSSLMEPARKIMEPIIMGARVEAPKISFIQNLTGDYAQNLNEVKNGLILQITERVQWLKSIEGMVSDGVESFIDVGPDRVLAKMVKRIFSEVAVYTASEFFSKASK